MKIEEWLNNSGKKIVKKEAEIILARELGVDRSYLVAHGGEILKKTVLECANLGLERRLMGEPIAYIVGRKEFYEDDFLVDNRVLIPRPETEEMVGVVINLIKHKYGGRAKLMEVGVGSGCVILSIAKQCPESEFLGLDVSREALEVAEINKERLGLLDIALRRGNLLKDMDGKWMIDEGFDIVVANLPYVDKKWDWISSECSFEPDLALYAEDGGVSLIRKLIDQLVEFKSLKGGRVKYLVLEYDNMQHLGIEKIAREKGLVLEERKGLCSVFRS